MAQLTEGQQLAALTAYLQNIGAPWYLRARRRLAFALRDVGLVELGYLVDYDRDRYADWERL